MVPQFSELQQLPPTLQRLVSHDDLDLNGHMNVVGFFTAQVGSVRAELERVGVTEEYVARRRMGTFAAEHHLRYFGELRAGEQLSTRVRFLERSDKAAHLQSYLVNDSQQKLACVLEVVAVHVDQETRRPTSFPDDLTVRLDDRIAASASLTWSLDPEISLRRTSRPA